MKLSNFRIKDRTLIKNQRIQNLGNQPEIQSLDENTSFKSQEPHLATLISSFEKILSTFLHANSSNTSSNSKKDFEKPKNYPRFDQIDFRDRFVYIQFPEVQNRKTDFEKLQNWLGQLSSQILSVSFHYLSQKKFDYSQTKAFASECFLRNIIVLAQNIDLHEEEIEFIDRELKYNIFPYLKSKYPLTNQKQINKIFQASVESIDLSEVLQNDYLFSSNVVFDFREDGRYDDLIMRLLNQIMVRCQQDQPKNESMFKQFQKLMTSVFQKSFYPEQMNNSFKYPNQRYQQDLNNNNSIIKTKQQLEFSQKYKESVKKYTSFQIGRKISQNTPQYTQQQIENKCFKIKSSAVLRILTKWCQELSQKIDNRSYFTQRKEGFTMIGKKQVCLIEDRVKKLLQWGAFTNRKPVQQMLSKIQEINYSQQIKILLNELSRNEGLYIKKEERVSGLFACKNVNNLENFIIDYLNILIHTLMTISKNCHSSLNYDQKFIIPHPLNLLSFKISDLLRCKYSSKEKEVLKTFKQIRNLSQNNPDKFKIIRIKNRLSLSTNDILINAKLNGVINCEIQIAVNNAESNFVDCCNKINHFIYELERAKFGPILELCNIWKSNERRADSYVRIIERQKPKLSQSTKLSTQIAQFKFQHPFICSLCNIHYYQDNFILDHLCNQEQTYWKCANCSIREHAQAGNSQFFLSRDKNFKRNPKNFTLWKQTMNCIPSSGACIFIKKSQTEVILFRTITEEFKKYLITLENNKYKILTTINTLQDEKKFFENYLVFVVQGAQTDSYFQKNSSKISEEIVSTILLPNQFKKFFKQSRQSISIIGSYYLSKLNLKEIFNSYTQTQTQKPNIKSIEFSQCNLQNTDLILQEFTSLNRVILTKNIISNFDRLCFLTNLQKIYLSKNKIKEIPNQISNLQQLKELRLRQNAIQILPQGLFLVKSLDILDLSSNLLVEVSQNFEKLQNLTQILFEENKFKEFPKVFSKMKNLKSANFYGCKFKILPQEIGKLEKLQILYLSGNQLQQVPSSLSEMKQLTQLFVQKNKLITLPQSICELKQLQNLSFCQNRSTNLSERLGELRKLTKFSCRNNELKSLPDSFIKLQNLKDLQLEYNLLMELPENFGKLTKLIKINMRHNRLKIIPKSIENLTNLKELDLIDNQIQELPDEIGNLNKLEIFKIRNNKLSTIPFSFGNLKNLTDLDLYKNKLKQLPESFGNLKHLLRILLGSNCLVRIPNSICTLKNLNDLQVEKNSLIELPEKIGNLKRLTKFSIHNNKLTELPESFQHLTKLTTLEFSENKFTQLPPKLSRLTNISIVECEKNQFSEIPDLIYSLSKISRLDFKNNQLCSVSEKIGNLTKLFHLQLSRNKLKSIPSTIANISNLTQLFLDNNQLTTIPIQICLHPKISYLSLENNYIEIIPAEINQMKSLKNQQLNLDGNPVKIVEDQQFASKKCRNWYRMYQNIKSIKKN